MQLLYIFFYINNNIIRENITGSEDRQIIKTIPEGYRTEFRRKQSQNKNLLAEIL